MGSVMARRCQLTGAVGRSGNNISHSHRRTKRRFEVNVQTKRYWVPSEQRHVTLTVSAKAIKTIDRRGIDAVVKELRARGEKV
jgi:large subunit ribosomal protein L28